MPVVLWASLLGLLGLAATVGIARRVAAESPGAGRMVEVADAVREAAFTLGGRAARLLLPCLAVVAALLAAAIAPVSGGAFAAGALCSMLAGWIGLDAATRATVRAAAAAGSRGRPRALALAFYGGSAMGLAVASLGLLGLGLFVMRTPDPVAINGFALGASSVALLVRIGGGIYAQAAAGAAVEAPEDDGRNPAVIADRVGDHVTGVVGVGADLFESYVGCIAAAIAIAATLPNPAPWMALPVGIAMAGLAASAVGVASMRLLARRDPHDALRDATIIASGVLMVLAFALTRLMKVGAQPFWAVVSGLVAGGIIGYLTEIYTSGATAADVGEASERGAAATVVAGVAVGLESTALPAAAVCGAVFVAFQADGLYGIALAGVGMLATVGITLSVSAYGPIAAGAGAIADMARLGPDTRAITDRLDALGRATAVIGKGFAIGAAAMTALALAVAYGRSVGLRTINLADPNVVIGLLLGGIVPTLVAAHVLRAPGRAAARLAEEVRRQLRGAGGGLESRPDTGRCVQIAGAAALRRTIVPVVFAVLAPALTGFTLGREALGGFLAGATIVGMLLAFATANAGGAWAGAMRYIEGGHAGGKGSEAHRAAAVGDAVGGAFRDTVGPAMSVLIKLMAVLALVLAPLLR